jgi:hypothetical protein
MTQKNKIRDSKRVSDVEGGTGGNEGFSAWAKAADDLYAISKAQWLSYMKLLADDHQPL